MSLDLEPAAGDTAEAQTYIVKNPVASVQLALPQNDLEELYLVDEANGIEPRLEGVQTVAHHSFSIFLRLLFRTSRHFKIELNTIDGIEHNLNTTATNTYVAPPTPTQLLKSGCR